MTQRQRLFVFILLNIFVSACVTLSILFAYDQYYRPSTLPVALPAETALPSSEGGQMEITTVIGAGLLDSEVVLLRNIGTGDVVLTGWKLQDTDGNVYTFPALTLHKSGAVQLHTAPGSDTIVDQYWNLPQSVWKSGELVTLLDAAGNVRAVYQIP
jgi:hypothetical protein